MRVINALIAGFAVLLGAFLTKHYINLAVWLSSFSVLLITIGGNLINDYFDAGIDKINNPQRPIPSGKMTPGKALKVSIILFILGNVIFAFINLRLLYVGLFASLLLILYTPFLKPLPLIGDIGISLLLALTLLVGAISASGKLNVILFPAIFAFLLNFPREILKDGEDIIGDRKAGLHTFPIVFGIEKTRLLVLVLLIFLVISIVYASFSYGALFALCAGFGVVLPVIIMVKRSKNSPVWFRNTERILKISIIPGMLALMLSGIR